MKITAANGDDVEVELPVEIIQYIQSSVIQLRGEEEAARTSLVSKSWYRAWSTRPDLDFDRFYFRSCDDLFWEFANTTMKRYEDLNLNIRSLRLHMRADDVSLAKELIVKAIKLGVVDLTIECFETVETHKQFVLPDELLRPQTLARLCLSGPWYGSMTIDLSPLRREKKKEEEVTCFNLKSLKLEFVTVNGDLFRDLISRCPLIEEFTLYSVNDDTSTSRNLMDREFDKLHDYLPKLKYLSLEVECDLPRHVLCAQFAYLKELEISYQCDDDDHDHDLRIRIPSLERISLTLSSLWNNVSVEFDFPNIRKFKLKGDLPPRLKLKTSTARRDQWESKLDIGYQPASDEWFSRLSKFVRMLNLSRSRVSLSILVYRDIQDEDEFRYIGDGLAIPAVEKLKLRGCKTVTPAFLDALFWSCRPKFVEIQNRCLFGLKEVNVEEFQQLRCLFGLKEVNVEEFQQLRSLPWETFYHVSSNKYGYDVGFQLN